MRNYEPNIKNKTNKELEIEKDENGENWVQTTTFRVGTKRFMRHRQALCYVMANGT